MILDSSKVSLTDGTQESAMEVYPGRDILSFVNHRATRARVTDKTVGASMDLIGLILSNGQKLTGTRKQKVAVVCKRNLSFKGLEQIEIGDTLRGETAGMPVNVRVTGLIFYPRKEMRLVQFELDHEKPFVAEGVLCR